MRNFINLLLEATAYHGTAYEFDEFDPSYLGSVTDSSDARIGFWLTDDYERARDAAIEAKNVSMDDCANCYIRLVRYDLKNPLYVDDVRDYDPEEVVDLAHDAKSQGHDGIIFDQGEGSDRDILVFDHSALKWGDRPKEWRNGRTEFEPIPE